MARASGHRRFAGNGKTSYLSHGYCIGGRGVALKFPSVARESQENVYLHVVSTFHRFSLLPGKRTCAVPHRVRHARVGMSVAMSDFMTHFDGMGGFL